jgi:erythromycin esterase-like protein
MRELFWNLRGHGRIRAAHHDLDLCIERALVEAHRFRTVAVETEVRNRVWHG